MAKKNSSITFKNAEINIKENTITEVMKDDITVHSLDKVLKEWDGVDGVSITIKKESEYSSDADENGTDGE